MIWWDRLLPLNFQRKRLLKHKSNTPLKQYLSTPIPSGRQLINETEFLVVDIETSGLNPKVDHILSVGYTLIKHNRVILKDCTYSVIKQKAELTNENVAIHQLTDSDVSRGVVLKLVLDQLINDLTGRVLVAHHASIELGFINAACKKIYDCELPLQVVDTFQIEKKRRQRRHQIIKANELRLFNLRREFGLPRYKAHNALEDAIATAELLLVQSALVCGGERCSIRNLM